MMTCENITPLISAHVDSELSPDKESRVAAHLEICGACRAMADDYRMLSRQLRDQGRLGASSDLRNRIREKLAEEVERTLSPSTDAPRVSQLARKGTVVADWRQLAATLALCVLSSAATFHFTRSYDQTDEAEGALASAHVRALLQDNPLQVTSSDSHTVRPWFAGRVDFAPTVKDLAEQGYPLLGGRLDLVAGQRVAVAVYKRNLHWINVYMWQAGAAIPIADGATTRSGYNIFKWTRDGVVYCAMSDANLGELRKLQALLS